MSWNVQTSDNSCIGTANLAASSWGCACVGRRRQRCKWTVTNANQATGCLQPRHTLCRWIRILQGSLRSWVPTCCCWTCPPPLSWALISRFAAILQRSKYLNPSKVLMAGWPVQTFQVGPKFKGLKMIPPGVHFLSFCQLGKPGQLAPYSGRFLSLTEGQVCVMRWDASIEALAALADEDEVNDASAHCKVWISAPLEGLSRFHLQLALLKCINICNWISLCSSWASCTWQFSKHMGGPRPILVGRMTDCRALSTLWLNKACTSRCCCRAECLGRSPWGHKHMETLCA